MRRLAWLLFLLLAASRTSALPAASEPRFRALDVFVQADGALAAWQVEVVVRGDGRIVGVEGGVQAPFDQAPYYDPAALSHGRIILAAFDTHASLPPGRHRVATLHVRELGQAEYELRLRVAADPGGERIPAKAVLQPQTPAPGAAP